MSGMLVCVSINMYVSVCVSMYVLVVHLQSKKHVVCVKGSPVGNALTDASCALMTVPYNCACLKKACVAEARNKSHCFEVKNACARRNKLFASRRIARRMLTKDKYICALECSFILRANCSAFEITLVRVTTLKHFKHNNFSYNSPPSMR